METDRFVQTLRDFTRRQPAHRVLLAPSRGVGQRLLAQAARQGLPVAGITVHSIYTLAVELCAGAMAGPRPLRLLTRLQAEQQVQQLLWQLRGEDAFAGGPWQTGAAARAVWRQLEEEDLAGAAAPADARLQILHRLLCSRLEERGLLTRPMLCRLAIRQLEQGRAALPAREFARLDCVRLTRLEQALWDALTRGREQVLPLPDGSLEELAARLRPRCRFVACRGAENQIRWILHDLARAGAAPDSAAVAVASGKTAVQLWQEGQRVGLPVAVDGGLPLSGCPLAALLRSLDAWRQQGYEAETLIDLLGSPGFATLRPALLIRQLRRRLVAFGPGRYELLWAEEDADLPADAHALWQAFFRCLLAALTPGDGQKQALDDLLADYGHAAGACSGAALAQVRALLAQLEPQAGQDLLCLLLDAIEGSRYLSSGPRPGALFCAGFARCLGCGADTLYVTGLSAAELLGTSKPLAFGGQPALPEEPAADSLRRLLFSACGRVVLLRPAYTVEDLLERSPALLYTRLLEGCGAAEETFGFADQPQLPPACPPPPARGVLPAPARTYPELAGWLLQTPLSATALETALQCPYRFMLQYLLQISADQPLPLPRTRWLEPNALGTLVHGVLQAWFDPNAPRPARPEELLDRQVNRLLACYPPAAADLVQKDLAKARALVEAGLRTLPAGCRVLATELGFGGRQAPVVVQVGAYSLSVCGSIDRLDQAPDGSWIVVDYKTGRIDDYRDRPDLHVQPLLYALAAEAIHGRPGAVHSARYEGLADGSTVEIPLAGPHRELAIQKLAAFLDYLCRTAHSPDLDPCLVWEEGRWQPGGESARESARPCDTFCPYKNFCPAKGGDRDGRRGGTSPAQLPGPGPGLV